MPTSTVFSNTGKGITTARLRGSGAEPKHVAWGTGTGTAAVGDTTLFTEAAEARVEGVSSQQTTDVANDTYQVVATLTAAAPKTITNVGLLDAATAGNIFMKSSFTGVELDTGEAIQFTLGVQYADEAAV